MRNPISIKTILRSVKLFAFLTTETNEHRLYITLYNPNCNWLKPRVQSKSTEEEILIRTWWATATAMLRYYLQFKIIVLNLTIWLIPCKSYSGIISETYFFSSLIKTTSFLFSKKNQSKQNLLSQTNSAFLHI